MKSVLTLVSLLAVFSAPLRQAEAETCASCTASPGLALLQTHRTVALTAAGGGPIKSGDSIFLRVARTGRRLSVQEDNMLHAKWSNRGTWERFTVERKDGDGELWSGNLVFLKAWTGKPLTVGDYEAEQLVRTTVHAKWGHFLEWQAITIEKAEPVGPIIDGDEIFLRGWTGAYLDSDAPDSAGVVQARWDQKGSWQKLVIEASGSPADEQEERGETVSATAWEHFQLVNQLRAEGFTCPMGEAFAPNSVPLLFDCRLWRASQLHSHDMATKDYFSHTSQDGRSPWDRAAKQGAQAHGENIAAGTSTATGTLEAFKSSDGHCRNMMKAEFKVMAVGYAFDSSSAWQHYWTQMYSLTDSIDTTCYPPWAALLQRSSGDAMGDDNEFVLAEAWSREAA